MSRPYAVLIAERTKLPPDVVIRQAMERMAKWSQVSSVKMVSLDEVAWLGALIDASLRKAKEDFERQKVQASVKKQMEEKIAERSPAPFAEAPTSPPSGVVHHVTLTDGITMQDGVR
jgi:hypothetical protein